MAKFDVYRSPDGRGYLLDCQADLLSGLNTRLTVPLLAPDFAPHPGARLNPLFRIEGMDHVMVTQFASSVPASLLKDRVTSLRKEEITIGNAIDMLLSGY